MRPVERVDEAAPGDPGPSSGLHGATHLQRQLVQGDLRIRGVESTLARQSPEIAVGADVVEPVIVDARMRQVQRHALERARSPELEELAAAGRVVLENRRSELEALRPLRPAPCAVASVNRENRRAVGRIPPALDRVDLLRRSLEQVIDGPLQMLRVTLVPDRDHFVSNAMMRTRSSEPTCFRPWELPVLVKIAAPGPTSVGVPSSVITPRPLRT